MSTKYCNCTNGTTRALCRPICDKDGYKKTKCMNAVRPQGLDPCQEGVYIYIFCHYSWLIIVRLQGFKVITRTNCMCTNGKALE